MAQGTRNLQNLTGRRPRPQRYARNLDRQFTPPGDENRPLTDNEDDVHSDSDMSLNSRAGRQRSSSVMLGWSQILQPRPIRDLQPASDRQNKANASFGIRDKQTPAAKLQNPSTTDASRRESEGMLATRSSPLNLTQSKDFSQDMAASKGQDMESSGTSEGGLSEEPEIIGIPSSLEGKYQEFFQAVLKGFYEQFSSSRTVRRKACQNRQEASGEASRQSSYKGKATTPCLRIGSRKRKRSLGQDDSGDNNDDGGNSSQPNSLILQSKNNDARLLACTYCKFNPARYSEMNNNEKDYRRCSNQYLPKIARLK